MLRFDSEDWNDPERSQTSPYYADMGIIALELAVFSARESLRRSRSKEPLARWEKEKEIAERNLSDYVEGCALLTESFLRIQKLDETLPAAKKPSPLGSNEKHPDNIRRNWLKRLTSLANGLFVHYRVKHAFEGNPFVNSYGGTWVHFRLDVSMPKKMREFISEHAHKWDSASSSWREGEENATQSQN